MAEIIGKCPHCYSDVLISKYGAFCSGKCGMSFNYAMGRRITNEQVKDLLSWIPIYIQELKHRDGSTYNAFIRPEKVVAYAYKNKKGERKEGFQYSFSIEPL